MLAISARRHGRGRCEYLAYPQGVYEGEWAGGKKHGHGTFTRANGRRYEGGWAAGKKHGLGTYRWPNGDSFTGNFVAGKPEDPAAMSAARTGSHGR